MMTIAITIDEPTLKRIDRIAAAARSGAKGRRGASRSHVVRVALKEYVVRMEREEREERERHIYAKHKKRLDAQARALVEEQALP